MMRTLETVAWDWRGSKGICRQWSKSGVELLLEQLNGATEEKEESKFRHADTACGHPPKAEVK